MTSKKEAQLFIVQLKGQWLWAVLRPYWQEVNHWRPMRVVLSCGYLPPMISPQA